MPVCTRLMERGIKIGGDLGAIVALGPDLTRKQWAKTLGISVGAVDRLLHAADMLAVEEGTSADLQDVVRDAYVLLCFGDIEGAGVVLKAAL